MSETIDTSKKPARKPDPMTQAVNDVRASIKKLGEYDTKDYPTTRIRHYDERASAWARQYGREGMIDGLILSLAFESLATYPHERRGALLQLAAVALDEAARLDGAE